MINLIQLSNVRNLNVVGNMSAFTKPLVLLLSVMMLSACGDNGVKISTDFRSAQGVKEGARIYYQEAKVGQVIEVQTIGENSGSRVFMLIDLDAAAKIDAQAAVAVNRIKPGSPLEIYASAAARDFGIEDGQQLKGLNSMIELVAWSVGDAIDVGTGELAGYVDSFQDYLAGEQFEEDRARVEQGVKEMAAIASETMKTVEQDLSDAISDIAVSEEELAAAILELGDEMSPIAEEMAKSGTDLMAELEKFTNGLENATAEEQLAGQKLIDSLIETIEKLNAAAERGAEQGAEEPIE